MTSATNAWIATVSEELASVCEICGQTRFHCMDVPLDGGDIHACPECLAQFFGEDVETKVRQ